MLEFYNPHPQQKIVGDCVKRALTKATGKTYQEVSRDLNRIKRAQSAKAYNSNSVWKAYLDELSAVRTSFPAEKGTKRMNGQKFCEVYKEGTYILNMARHLVACVDGVLYDTWDCQEKCVYAAYEIINPSEGSLPLSEISPILDTRRSASSPASPYEKFNSSGKYIIYKMSELTGCPVKETKKGELWISLSPINYDIVLKELLLMSHLRWETRRGSNKSKIWDEKSNMTLILRSGDNPYLWCTCDGE